MLYKIKCFISELPNRTNAFYRDFQFHKCNRTYKCIGVTQLYKNPIRKQRQKAVRNVIWKKDQKRIHKIIRNAKPSHMHTCTDSSVIVCSFEILHLSREMTKITKWLCAQRRLRSAWASADAQANLSLRWAHTQFVGFVMSRLFWFRMWSRLIQQCSTSVL